MGDRGQRSGEFFRKGTTKVATLAHIFAIAAVPVTLSVTGCSGDAESPNEATEATLSLGGGLSIAAADSHSCAVNRAGGVACWGSNTYGELGNGQTTGSMKALRVAAPLTSNVASVSAGLYFSCALTNAGAVWCWGRNLFGNLGNGSYADSRTPKMTGLSAGVVQIAAGQFHACALTSQGTVKCWGANSNLNEQLGKPAPRKPLPGGTIPGNHSPVPVDVLGLTDVVSISAPAAGNHTCALLSSGTVKCWGDNSFGPLGDNPAANPAPVVVRGFDKIIALSTGTYDTCGITASHTVQCVGFNRSGELGNNTTIDSKLPVFVQGLSDVSSIAVGNTHACAITSGGMVSCWGGNEAGQVGNNSTRNALVPVAVQGLTAPIGAVTGGTYHSCALTTSGFGFCWGNNGYGQLGKDSAGDSLTAANVVGL